MANILMVDDDSLARKIFGRILTGQGYHCSFALNADQAKSHLEHLNRKYRQHLEEMLEERTTKPE